MTGNSDGRWLARSGGSWAGWRRRCAGASFVVASVVAVVAEGERPAGAGAGRVALVIGNGGYEWLEPLSHAVGDARAVGRALARLGIDVTMVGDGGRAEMLEALRAFEARSRGAEAALVFYTGYGMRAGGADYLVPVDAESGGVGTMLGPVSLETVLAATGRAGVRVVILDVCPTDRWPMLADGGAGISRAGVHVALARGACDGAAGEGPQSTFSGALLKQLEVSSVEVGRLLRGAATETRGVGGDAASPQVVSVALSNAPEFHLTRSIETSDLEGLAARLADLLGRELSTLRSEEDGWTDLHYAAALGLPDLARRLLDAGAATDARLRFDGEPLGTSVTETLDALGHSPRVTRRGGETALHLAAAFDAREVAAELVRRGAAVEARNESGETPLHVAAWADARDTAAFLVASGADPRARSGSGATPLHRAAGANALGTAMSLAGGGGEVNARDNRGDTPLHWAARWNAPETAEFLLDRGADLHARDDRGETPLHSFWRNARKTVALLVDRGADVEARDSLGRTPLHAAAASTWADADTVESLLDGGADIEARDGRGDAPLHLAARLAVPETVGVLLDRGARVDAEDERGRTPLHGAAGSRLGSWEVASVLLDGGADVQARTRIGETPLHLAARRNAGEVAAVLLSRGADVNAVDLAGRTPLHLAARRNAREAAEVLLNYGAEVNAVDVAGVKPLALVREDGKTDGDDVVRELLRSHGAE